MLHINKLKFGLKEKNTLKKFTQNVSKFVSYDSTILNVGKKNKNDTKILVTIGPKSCSSDSILAISKFTNLFRINGSHNSIKWHTNVSKKIKAICPNSFILLDIPGLKPRTDNKVDIKIKKNQLVNFTYCGAKTEKGILSIETTKPLPYVNDPVDEFSLSDGLYKFKFVKSYKNFIQGISTTEFILKPKKGLNIPHSCYDDDLQQDLYIDFIKNSGTINFDAIGLSFIQNGNILQIIRNTFKNKVLVSKIENLYGLNNASEISKNSDLVMIDRGDLLAEIGANNLYKSICEISNQAIINNKPLIMATENLESMQKRLQPSKSEIIALEHSINLGTDIIMLSDETATSPFFMNTLEWLYDFLNK